MKILKEITDWSGLEYNVKNHTYAINDSGKCVAYRRTGTKEWLTFSKPKSFSRSHRKFVTLKEEFNE
jgi:hypothetical protein